MGTKYLKLRQLALLCLTGLFVCGFALWGLLQPDRELSYSERRPLASFPAPQPDTILSGEYMSALERYTLDQFPLRETFRTLKAVTVYSLLRQSDNNGIYLSDGCAAQLDGPIDDDSITHAAGRFRFLYDRYLKDTGSAVYLSVIPDKSCFLDAPAIDCDAFAAKVRAQTEFARYLDIVPLLERADYYRTDSHWRQEALEDVAAEIARQMGRPEPGTFTRTDTGTPFYGVYCGQSALPLAPDKLYYLDSATLRACRVYDYETDRELPVYDLDRLTGPDPYELFLSGSKALLTLENPNAATDKELILFRDSFGSSLAPLLADCYRKITLVDIRYLRPETLGQFLTFDGQDVLFLYSMPVLNNSVTLK